MFFYPVKTQRLWESSVCNNNIEKGPNINSAYRCGFARHISRSRTVHLAKTACHFINLRPSTGHLNLNGFLGQTSPYDYCSAPVPLGISILVAQYWYRYVTDKSGAIGRLRLYATDCCGTWWNDPRGNTGFLRLHGGTH